MKNVLLPALLLISAASAAGTESLILPMRERAAVIDRLLEDRIRTVLPSLMRRTGIDMWVIISREYNEDPVIRTFLPSTWQSARRTTILLIHDRGGDEPLETLAVARYAVGDTFERAWDKEVHGEQWTRLAALIAERNPDRIGLNYSDEFALADGISHTEYRQFHDALPEALRARRVGRGACDRLAGDPQRGGNGDLPSNMPYRARDHRRRTVRGGHPAGCDDDQ